MVSYTGSCFCGAVKIRVTGQPNAMGYCHCRSCRSWSAGPVNAFTLWPPDVVEVTQGAENVATYKKTDLSHRQFCRVCGGHLMTMHPPLNMIDVYAATIPDLEFVPQVHVNYGDSLADAGWLTEAQGLPEGVRRLRRNSPGMKVNSLQLIVFAGQVCGTRMS